MALCNVAAFERTGRGRTGEGPDGSGGAAANNNPVPETDRAWTIMETGDHIVIDDSSRNRLRRGALCSLAAAFFPSTELIVVPVLYFTVRRTTHGRRERV